MDISDEFFLERRDTFFRRNRRKIELMLTLIFIALLIILITNFSTDEKSNSTNTNNNSNLKPNQDKTPNSDSADSNKKPINTSPESPKKPNINEFILNFEFLESSSPAKCLDGSPYGVYLARGYGNGAKKLIINFWGASWCLGKNQSSIIDSCAPRVKSEDGSSQYFKAQYRYEYDFLGKEESKNKYFFNWNKLDVPYCDGTGSQGRRGEPVFSHNNTKLHFRGYDNTIAAFDYLFGKIDVKDLDMIVLSGCSSGGFTVMQWLQYMEDYVKEKKSNAVVLGINMGGFFIDYKNIKTNDNDYGIKMKAMHQFVNQETPVVNKDCVKDNQENPHLCLLPEVLVKYIKAPLLLFQAAFDSWSLKNILGEDCADADYTLNTCNQEQIKNIKQYKDYSKGLLQEAAKAQKNLSVWSPTCIFHCFWNIKRESRSFSVDGKTINDVIGEFMDSKGQKQILLFDNFEGPENRQCS